MYTIHAPTYGAGWISCIRCILNNGNSIKDGEQDLIECINIIVEIAYPLDEDLLIASLANAELTNRAILKFEKIEILPNAFFSYAQRLYNNSGVDQVDWIVRRLKSKPESKSATISTLIAGDENPHIPCLSLLDFKIRDNKLNLTSVFRSQDVLTRHPGNSMALSRLHTRIAQKLNFEKGKHIMHIISGHIYEHDLSSMSDKLRDEVYKQP